ncbi:glycoside hydrolase family 5 protein [Pseudovirgaria hyperparasitica]|uniref:mannan endo-1,4-beta-mannosidase n=1 Tax=Pseudovirgaria hyperparasitica TaxID=470096 RepID=A0A6A6WK66_9PEZI|nr:glycoside hydrolase family 5 protein [Pseudovirgaria hyperparasitica]KAF2762541.1 glycoside hydrolase family 5 protein [Pseudovirgaria hyperparasitica]
MKTFTSLTVALLASAQAASAFQSWVGSNLYYAAGLDTDQQDTLLCALSEAGVKVLRVWLDGEEANQKGTQHVAYPSLEVDYIGDWDDTVLERYDDFMVNAKDYGIKLQISPHSWNALDAGDVYTEKFGREGFYNSSEAADMYKGRIAHVLQHVNKNTGKTWAESGDMIFGFETQNEAMNGLGADFLQQHSSWHCDIATAIKSGLPASTGEGSIPLVMTGGGCCDDTSVQDAYFDCEALDVIAIHTYGPSEFATDRLTPFVDKAIDAGKKLLFQEWGVCYFDTENNNCPEGTALSDEDRAANLTKWAGEIGEAGIPWMYWQIIPNDDPHYGYDFEIGTTENIFESFKEVALAAREYETPFDFSPWLL